MIDPALQAQLRARFNPDGSDLRKMQLRMLDMLKYLDEVCKKNNIKYWLSSGTCIGAVRHGGFIPWDDDCDIEMKRSDYKKLIKVLRKQKNSRFVLQDIHTDPNYIHPWAKLRDLDSEVYETNQTDQWNDFKGCFIDIFCIEPSNSKKIWKLGGDLWYKGMSLVMKIKNPNRRKKVIPFFHFCFNYSVRPILKFLNFFCGSNTTYRHKLGMLFLKKRYVEDIEEQTDCRFEDQSFPIPLNYDHYLRTLYGDYMALPDVEKIKSHFKTVKIN